MTLCQKLRKKSERSEVQVLEISYAILIFRSCDFFSWRIMLKSCRENRWGLQSSGDFDWWTRSIVCITSKNFYFLLLFHYIEKQTILNRKSNWFKTCNISVEHDKWGKISKEPLFICSNYTDFSKISIALLRLGVIRWRWWSVRVYHYQRGSGIAKNFINPLEQSSPLEEAK